MSIFKLFGVFFMTWLLIIALVWGLLVFCVVKGCNAIQTKGAKQIGNELYYGTNGSPPEAITNATNK